MTIAFSGGVRTLKSAASHSSPSGGTCVTWQEVRMPEHAEWTKSLSNGRAVMYCYDEINGISSASIEIGKYFKSSRTNLPGPLTREQVEALFLREIDLVNYMEPHWSPVSGLWLQIWRGRRRQQIS